MRFGFSLKVQTLYPLAFRVSIPDVGRKEVMSSIIPEMQALINARVRDGINRLIQDKFPDVGPVD